MNIFFFFCYLYKKYTVYRKRTVSICEVRNIASRLRCHPLVTLSTSRDKCKINLIYDEGETRERYEQEKQEK